MRFYLLLQSLLYIFLLSACSDYQPTVEVNVKVQRDKSAGQWKVTYDSSIGFRVLNFDRQRYRMRSSTWRILTPGVRLENTAFSEQVVADQPITHFEVEFDDRTPGVANDYPIVSYYSDGGALLYTGHFFLKVPDCDGCKVHHHFIYIPTEGENVITDENDNGLGDFVYFGQHTVTEYDSFRTVADDGIPPWIQRQIERSLPTFILHYQDRLGIPLKKKPLVFVAYDKAFQVREEGYLGGVVGSHMQLVLVGSKWNEADGVRYEKFAHLIAHEVFHLWNGALFLAPDRSGGSWLHEGSADAIADFALYELGYYDLDRYHQIQTERLNRCMVGLSQKSLPLSDEDGFYRNFYECGAVMNHLLERKFTDGTNLFDFWRQIFASSQNSFYSHEQFFSTAQRLVTDPSVISTISAVTAGSTGEPSTFFQNALNQLGIQFSVVSSNYPGWYQELESTSLINAIAEKDCGFRVPVDLGENGIRVEGAESCSTIKSTREIRSLAGYNLPSSGAEAHDSVYNQCSSNTVATAYDTHGDTIVTSCLGFAKRPAFINW